MFESAARVDRSVDGLEARACADALHESVVQARMIGARRLALAAHWADLHHPDRRVGGRTGCVRVQVGAAGTPEISEFAATELGVLLQTTTASATALLRDALELRHRMPLLWGAVQSGDVEDWKARKAVGLTRLLTEDQAAWVDGQVVGALVGLPFGRALTVVEGKVIAADPAAHERRRDEAEHRRYVALGRRNGVGVQTMFARGAAGDLVRLMAMVNHLADRLGEDGDTASADERRAKALGLLANPALACVFLAQRAGHGVAGDGPAGPDGPEPAHRTVVHDAVRLGAALLQCGAGIVERLRPRSVLYVHAHVDTVGREAGVVRAEGLGPLGVPQLRDWLGHDRVTVRPVAYPLEQAGTDSYEIPRPLAEAVRLLRPFEVFPWGTLESRRGDLDHTERFGVPKRSAPPQTRLENLGPLGRRAHRAKTHGGFHLRQPEPGSYYWRLPTGRWYHVDRHGSHALEHETPVAVSSPRGSVGEAWLRVRLAA